MGTLMETDRKTQNGIFQVSNHPDNPIVVGRLTLGRLVEDSGTVPYKIQEATRKLLL